MCVLREYLKKLRNVVAHNLNDMALQEKLLYKQVDLSSHCITKNNLELQQNPACSLSSKVIMDANPAFSESYK